MCVGLSVLGDAALCLQGCMRGAEIVYKHCSEKFASQF